MKEIEKIEKDFKKWKKNGRKNKKKRIRYICMISFLPSKFPKDLVWLFFEGALTMKDSHAADKYEIISLERWIDSFLQKMVHVKNIKSSHLLQFYI